MTQDASRAVRSRIVALEESLTLAMFFAVAASAAGLELVDQVYLVPRFSKQRLEPLALELAMLPLLLVAYRDDEFLAASELLDEITQCIPPCVSLRYRTRTGSP